MDEPYWNNFKETLKIECELYKINSFDLYIEDPASLSPQSLEAVSGYFFNDILLMHQGGLPWSELQSSRIDNGLVKITYQNIQGIIDHLENNLDFVEKILKRRISSAIEEVRDEYEKQTDLNVLFESFKQICRNNQEKWRKMREELSHD